MYKNFVYLLDTQENIRGHLIQKGCLSPIARKTKAESDLKLFDFMAIEAGGVDLLNCIINRYPTIIPNINTEQSANGLTALHIAVLSRKLEMVRFLISHGANDQRLDESLTALELLVLNSKIPFDENTKKIIELLLPFSIYSELTLFLDFLKASEDEYPGAFEEVSTLVSEFSIQEALEILVNPNLKIDINNHSESKDERKQSADEISTDSSSPCTDKAEICRPPKKAKLNHTTEESDYIPPILGHFSEFYTKDHIG